MPARLPLLSLLLICLTTAGCAPSRPTVWYCRTYNTPNHRQYRVDETGDRGWSRVYASLEPHVHWRANDELPTAEALEDVDLVVILNPEADSWEAGPAPRLMSEADIDMFAEFVHNGGALLFGSNQDLAHNIEKVNTNRLLRRFGMEVGREDIGLKVLELPESSPVGGGLTWRFFLGSGIAIHPNDAVTPEVWAWNDPQAPTLEGEPGERVPVLAAARVDRGRVIVIGDSGWSANGTIGLDDNWEMLWRQLRWLLPDRLPTQTPALASWTSPSEH